MSYTSFQEYGTAHFKIFSYPKNNNIFQIYRFQGYISVVTKKDDLLFSNAMQKITILIVKQRNQSDSDYTLRL